ncbi:MAG: hypothetical protein KBT11_04310 [Treponema sp.]|nr:hypothetical protein [Candidatus Treponema equifaecale]
MKNLKKLFIAAALFSASFSAFAIEGFLHDSFFAICSYIKDFSDIAIRENIVNGRAAAASPLDLKVGDIFIDVDGNAKKVVKITRYENNITIDTEPPEPQEVFDIITIPRQVADFKAAEEEKYASRTATEESARAVSNAEKKLLDGLMPDYDIKVSPKLSPFFSPIGIKDSSGGLLEACKQAIADPNNTPEEKEHLENTKQQIQNKFTTAKASPTFSITPDIRRKSYQNDFICDFSYVKPGIDTHGTWKFWKWTTYYDPGYYDFQWLSDIAWGMGIDVAGGVKGTVSFPLVPVGSDAFGPYCGIYWDIGLNVTVSGSYYFYTRTAKYTESFSNFNTVFIPSNERAETIEWSPSAHQVDLLLNGSANTGPSLKAGFVAFGMRLVEIYAGGGVKIDACVGGAWTNKNNDAENYAALCKKINWGLARSSGKTKESFEAFRDRLVEDNLVTGGTSKWSKAWNNYEDGWQFLGKVQSSLYLNVDLKMFQDRVNLNLFNISYPFWSLTGDGKPTAKWSAPWGTGDFKGDKSE